MSSVDDAVSYVFVWHCLSDACPKCQSLNGQEFNDQDLFQETLFSTIWGDIWDLDAGYALTHPNCRCQLEVRFSFDWEKIRELNMLQETLSHLGYEVELPVFEAVEMSADISRMREAVIGFRREMGPAISEAREMNRLLTVYIALGRRLGSEELGELIARFQQVRITAETAYRSIMLLYGASGPYGWLLGLGGLALSAFMTVDMMEVRRPRY